MMFEIAYIHLHPIRNALQIARLELLLVLKRRHRLLETSKPIEHF